MNDIAAHSGVSRSTVSCVLNGRAVELRIPATTQQRVLEVASELGYRHNEMARSVAGGKSRMIGFITGEPNTDVEFKSRVMVGVIEAAAERGYTVQVLYLPPDSLQHEVVERCIEWRLAGIVTLALHPRILNKLHREVARYDMEIAVLEDSQAYPWAVNVSSASADGMKQAVEHLLELGHQRLAMLAAAPDNDHAMWREQLFRNLCRERSIEITPGSIVHGDWWNPAVNEAAAKRLLVLAEDLRPTGVICCGDPAAMALLNTARALGISVPQQLSVVGYGDYSFSVFSDPPLTTVAQPFRELGNLAVNRLLDRIIKSSQDWNDLERATLSSTLTVRGSTGTAPAL